MNLANKLTLLRMIMVPIFLVFIYFEGIPYGKEIALVIFILAALTDKLDGYIARSRNLITDFGKFMDPLADKVLTAAALIVLVEFKMVAGWIVIIIIAREFAVSGLRLIAASKGNVLAADWWGKIKTVIQFVAIAIGLVTIIYPNNELLISLTNVSMYVAAIITVLSGANYFVKNKNVIKVE